MLPGYLDLINRVTHSVTVKHLSSKTLQELPIPLPPIQEQERIAKKIEVLNARANRARGELGHVVRLVKCFKDRLLEQAFSGKLTGDWRIANCAGDWATTVLQHFLESGPSNGWSPQSGDDATGAQTLKLTATTSGRLRLDDQAVKRIYEMPPPDSKYWLKPGDILIQRANAIEHVGISAIFDGPPKTYIFPDLMMRIRAQDPGATKFLWFYLNSPSVRKYFRDRATGTSGNMPKINGETVRSLPVPNVGAMERDEIVRRLERAFAVVDRLAAGAQAAQADLDKLDQAILAKAFRGELVPEDPNDEQASFLLERIRTERAVAGSASKRGAAHAVRRERKGACQSPTTNPSCFPSCESPPRGLSAVSVRWRSALPTISA